LVVEHDRRAAALEQTPLDGACSFALPAPRGPVSQTTAPS
jgi:hypothetical protein